MALNPSTMPETERAQYRGRLVMEGERTYGAPASNEATAYTEPEPWAQQEQFGGENGANVAESERWTSLAAGAIVAGLGLGRRDLVGMAIAAVGGGLIYRGATGRCPMYNALGINTVTGEDIQGDTAQQADDGFGERVPRQRATRGVRVAQSFLVNRAPEELYAFWRNFENFPQIMSHVEEVRLLDPQGIRSHWVARVPAFRGKRLEWDAEMLEDVPNERISWRSLPGGSLETAGTVTFARGDRGAIVRVDMRYVAPMGLLGNALSRLLGEVPTRVLREDLRNFKRVMELGEIPTVVGQPRGTCLGRGKRQES
ncbi:MAG: hypothetical protein QOE14_1081 [Humisphaera sp.]|nr:hypothetical protein [Humisphaera sp.]